MQFLVRISKRIKNKKFRKKIENFDQEIYIFLNCIGKFIKKCETSIYENCTLKIFGLILVLTFIIILLLIFIIF